jgi:hypothetical protein
LDLPSTRKTFTGDSIPDEGGAFFGDAVTPWTAKHMIAPFIGLILNRKGELLSRLHVDLYTASAELGCEGTQQVNH